MASDVNPFIIAIDIEVVNGKLVHFDGRKHCLCVDALLDYSAFLDYVPCFFVYPVNKYFAFNKRIIWHIRNCVTRLQVDEILRFFAYRCAAVIVNDEGNAYLIFEIRIQGKILINRRFSCILIALTIRLGKPARESCAFFNGVGRKNNCRTFSGSHFFIVGSIHLELHREYILLIRSYNGRVSRYNRAN